MKTHDQFPNPYRDMIIEDLGCTVDDAAIVEDLMRNEIFHSTLDWQTREQLREGAREALEILNADREFFEGHYRKLRAEFQHRKAEAEAREKANAK